MDNCGGIVYNTPTNEVAHLELQKVAVKVVVVDVSAHIILYQTYRNVEENDTGRAKYIFPVPADAAICSFEVLFEDGHSVIGEVRDAEEAKRLYDESIRQGRKAALLRRSAGDYFTISLGSIPGKQSVTTTLKFVMDLINDDNIDDVRLQLPMYVAQRYGLPPPDILDVTAPLPTTRLKIDVEIQMGGKIREISSPTHPSVIVENYIHMDRPSQRRRRVKFRSTEYLHSDFVLIIQSDGLDAPRCFAELEPSSAVDRPSTLALQLRFIPKFKMPPVPSQEFLFLVDRSGSMGGSPIATTKDALNVLLRMLPQVDTTLNIFSFGSIVNSLWGQSREYTQQSLEEATSYVRSMDADYGGTEMLQAIREVLSSRCQRKPTAVFVLTDGQVHSQTIMTIVNLVSILVASAPHHAPLRIFTLGIGGQVSTELCQSLADAGNGEALFATTVESIIGKCTRLLQAGRTPFLKNVAIDWGISQSPLPSVNFIAKSGELLRPPPAIQQSPPAIGDLFAGSRVSVFAILQLKAASAPSHVTIRGVFDDDFSTPFEVHIPVRGVQLKSVETGLHFVHSLTAWRLIRDHENGLSPLPETRRLAPADEIRRAVIIRLGERYQLASSHTSFVALLEEPDAMQPHLSRNGNTTNGRPQQRRFNVLNFVMVSLFGKKRRNKSSNTSMRQRGRNYLDISADEGELDSSEESDSSSATFSTLSSLSSRSTSDSSERSYSIHRRPLMTDEQGRVSPELQITHEDQGSITNPAYPLFGRHETVDHDVLELLSTQHWDGSFDNAVAAFAGNDAVSRGDDLKIERYLWCTVLAVAFLEKRMEDANQRELSGYLIGKAMEFLEGAQREGADVHGLLLKAKKAIELDK